ncbi:MAG TPA: CPBP family intramembrane glutamic endopeptidase [Ktedonobacterales bacterium]|jgi:membrane protease YdiL (CAAX protease family)|nr:CPBP family intramembrane glutamic endopeptidase [Ktedonobacterales bacterium]
MLEVSQIAQQAPESPRGKLNWRHVGAFLGLTFGLTWLLDLLIYLHGGLSMPGSLNVVQVQMLFPAFSAILLQMFFFPESFLYRKRPAGPGRWFYSAFLVFTVLSALAVVGTYVGPVSEQVKLTATIVPPALAVAALLLLLVLRLVAGHEAMSRVGLSWGNWRNWLLFAPGIVAFYVLQGVLNALFGLGPVHSSIMPVPAGISATPYAVLIGVQSVLVAPLLALVIVFGEEYGWRGYLQSELLKLGRVRGVLLVGVVWGAWHWPLILMGFSYPGYPLFGLLLTVLFTMGFAVVLGTAVLRSGSILLAAYLHALNDQTTAFLVFLGYKPFNPVFSFGVGIYAIATLALITFLLLRTSVWRSSGSSLSSPPAREDQGK